MSSSVLQMHKPIIIFSGYNQRAVIAFIRTLESKQVPYAIIASSHDDTILLTDYRHKVLAVRTSKELELTDLVQTIKAVKEKLPAKRYVVAPSTEALNRFLLQHKSEFEHLQCEIPLVDYELYKQVSDKQAFTKLCVQHDIQVPQEYESIEQVTLPYVAKPKRYYSDEGEVYTPVLVFDDTQHRMFIEQHSADDFFYQQYIGGRSLYLLYYFSSQGEVYKYSQENFVQMHNGKSIIAAVASDIHTSNESQKYEQMFTSLNFFGLVMVEVKLHQDQYYMIEANPRFWGPSQLFVDAGMNLFTAFLHDVQDINENPKLESIAEDNRYFWFGGYMDTVTQKEAVAYHNYSAEKFAEQFPHWLMADIYNREDTRQIFNNETGMSI